MLGLETRQYFQLETVFSHRPVIGGWTSAHPLHEVLRSGKLPSATTRALLSYINTHIDDLYVEASRLAQQRDDGSDNPTQQRAEEQLHQLLSEIKSQETVAASLMRQFYESTESYRELQEAHLLLNRAKELLAQREGPAANDTAT